MIVLFTDFGVDDVYVAQVKAALLEHEPAATVVDLLHSAPNFRIDAAAHLLAALRERFAAGCVFMAVVDPGVGTERDAVVVEASGQWFVGPDNGLLSVVAARATRKRAWRIAWRPQRLAASFHARDLFAPIVAWFDRGDFPLDKLEAITELQVRLADGDLSEVIYIDHYGNAMTGLRAGNVPRRATIALHEQRLRYARTFAEAPDDAAFWYENSIGLVEIAAYRASASQRIGIHVGDRVSAIVET